MADHKVTSGRTALIGLSVLAVNGPSPARPHPDTLLFALFAEFEAARDIDAAEQQGMQATWSREAQEVASAATERAMAAAAAVSACRAHTVDGFRLKAHVALWHHGDSAAMSRADESGALASIVRDLLAIA